MKLVRYGAKGREQPGLIDAHGKVRALAGVVPDIGPDELSASGLARLGGVDPATLPLVAQPGRIAAPWSWCGKFLCIGLNYVDHAAEAGMPVPKEPILFMKPISARVGPNDAVVLPQGSVKGDWEVELGVVIGTRARYVPEADALNHVAGYCVVNDVSEREYQLERGGQWDKGKGCDTFGPVGPWLVTTDEVPDPQTLPMWCEVNGRRMQNGNTRTMVFGVRQLVSYLSRFMTLEPGDLIATGTPPGVGMGLKPQPQFLKPGDTMRVGIEGLGVQQQHVHAAMLGVEVLAAQRAVVQHLGADLGAAHHVGQRDQLRQRKSPRGAAVQEPGHVRLPGARQVVVARRRRHLRAGEMLEREASVRRLLELLAPFHQPLRHEVLRADELGHLDLELLLRRGRYGQAAEHCDRERPHGVPP